MLMFSWRILIRFRESKVFVALAKLVCKPSCSSNAVTKTPGSEAYVTFRRHLQLGFFDLPNIDGVYMETLNQKDKQNQSLTSFSTAILMASERALILAFKVRISRDRQSMDVLETCVSRVELGPATIRI